MKATKHKVVAPQRQAGKGSGHNHIIAGAGGAEVPERVPIGMQRP